MVNFQMISFKSKEMFRECTCASMLFLSLARTIHKIWDWITEKPDLSWKSSIQNSQTYVWFELTNKDLIRFILCCLSVSVSEVNPRGDGCVIDSVGGILSQCIYVSNHHVVHFKYLTILFVSCISIKLKNQEDNTSGI